MSSILQSWEVSPVSDGPRKSVSLASRIVFFEDMRSPILPLGLGVAFLNNFEDIFPLLFKLAVKCPHILVYSSFEQI